MTKQNAQLLVDKYCYQRGGMCETTDVVKLVQRLERQWNRELMRLWRNEEAKPHDQINSSYINALSDLRTSMSVRSRL
jgi:hypothetical protein